MNELESPTVFKIFLSLYSTLIVSEYIIWRIPKYKPYSKEFKIPKTKNMFTLKGLARMKFQ